MTTERRFAAAKYVIFILTAGYIVWLMLFIGESKVSFEKVSGAVDQAVDKGRLAEQSGLMLKRNFGLNSSDYAGVCYYASESGISAEEVLLICVESDSQIRQVTDALEARVEKQIGDFEEKAPDQVKLLEEARQTVNGRYIFFSVSSESGRYHQAFADSL
ncbi:MAG TPA: DUF4358 domain-containing protein [Candidatus Mediterraneibacter avicola]|nr:DUF4358 domain-containing protein [Candidatus Mediterraneibacter avicola]